MSVKVRRKLSEQDYVTTEISYPNTELQPDDVTDIIDRLHIGTLRREELKARQSILKDEAGKEEDEAAEMDDRELEEFYKYNGAHKPPLNRQSSRTSTSSTHSADSGGSGNPQPSTSNKRLSQQQSVETQEMGIQTTIGRNGVKMRHHEQEAEGLEKKKEKRNSTKEKMKRIFRRKSSTTENQNGDSSIEQPQLPELPQGFIVKYMGKRSTNGLWGSKHTRGAVEEIVDSIGKMPKGADLPLVNLDVFYQGLAMRPHSKNKIKAFTAVQIPIQFISYGLQDTVYPRVFCFIMVKEMSSQTKSMEVHAYACDSSRSARELAACLAIAFQTYSEKLDGGVFQFSTQIKMTVDEEEEEDITC